MPKVSFKIVPEPIKDGCHSYKISSEGNIVISHGGGFDFNCPKCSKSLFKNVYWEDLFGSTFQCPHCASFLMLERYD
jgi:hypothetical protein